MKSKSKLDYLSILYSRQEKPKTNYPSKLSRYIFDNFIKKKNKSLLEIGCGNCDMLNEFSLLGLKVQGTDIVESAGHEYPDIKVIENDIEKDGLPFEKNKFDIIFSKSVVEHIYNPEVFFKETFKVLKRNGILITLTPDWEVQKNKFFDDWTHKTPFTKVTMKRLYTISGFSDVRVNYLKPLPILWNSTFLYKLSNLLAPFIKEREQSKLRWVRERQILGIGVKIN